MREIIFDQFYQSKSAYTSRGAYFCSNLSMYERGYTRGDVYIMDFTVVAKKSIFNRISLSV